MYLQRRPDHRVTQPIGAAEKRMHGRSVQKGTKETKKKQRKKWERGGILPMLPHDPFLSCFSFFVSFCKNSFSTMRFLSLLLVVLSPVAALAGDFTFRRPSMGTLWTIKLYADEEKVAQEAAAAAFARVEELNAILSDYLPESE